MNNRHQQHIVNELRQMAERLEQIQHETKVSLKGYASGAAEVAALAVHHVIDLVRVAEKVSE